MLRICSSFMVHHLLRFCFCCSLKAFAKCMIVAKVCSSAHGHQFAFIASYILIVRTLKLNPVHHCLLRFPRCLFSAGKQQPNSANLDVILTSGHMQWRRSIKEKSGIHARNKQHYDLQSFRREWHHTTCLSACPLWTRRGLDKLPHDLEKKNNAAGSIP
jgi:hypothetical protein